MGEPSGLTELVAAASGGDENAWSVIVARFSSLLWGVARAHRLDQSDAADVVQNTWLRLLDNLGRIERPEALAGWLATTARYESLSVLRRRGREHLVRDEDLAGRAVDVEAIGLDTALLGDEQDAQLWSCFAQLSQRCQRLLRVLMVCDRPSYSAVSQALDIPVGSIGPTRMRCLRTLREAVAGSGYVFEPGGRS
ncbi:MAG: sigma-70 family RNA polymerase sigma factor [Intrasporangium sp.]|uniref:RNA polymerase sigma factor n=1 Tax=Intrasporangium sp. TaxID=1925024 RepID=UPI002648134F|nr:sigma-70 family RNA polymerase sigma factor [Intrasporangium sp.]MDN5795262.1 sigma-70 family RNA polymerase sigma factor [Intrasporangium sp.]